MLLSNSEKLAVFRALFRGRDDVYPTYWENKGRGTSGYSPACKNKFVAGLCELAKKKKVKCAACSNRAFKPVDNRAVTLHLRGAHVMGVYPLLAGDTCWFLAADFDDSTWREDVLAVWDTCRRMNLPAYVERSRSGNGAHLWLFFEAAVPASEARKLGCHLLTEAMSRRPELSFHSYDRLFPSQDTMPDGGFGNLIALPLQRAARAKGTSVFLDERLEPYPDEQQWVLLANAKRICLETAAEIVAKATRSGKVLGVRSTDAVDDEERHEPWTRAPSGAPSKLRLPHPLPQAIEAVIAQRLYVARADLPPALLNRIKRLAAFQNPEYYKKRAMRLSLDGTPRIICCAEDLPEHLALPRGLLGDLEQVARDHGIPVRLTDKRNDGTSQDFAFAGQLTPLQTAALDALLAHDIGVLVAPPGVGKTVIAIALIAQRRRNTLVLVHRLPLLEQWRAQLALFLALDPTEIGQIGGGKCTATGRLDVAMLQSLVRDHIVNDVVAQYGQVIVDECHHLPAVSFEQVLSEVHARHVVGLTATPTRRDGLQPITEMQLGPIRYEVSAKSQAEARPFRHKLIVRQTGFRLTSDKPDISMAELYGDLARNAQRNELILDDVIATIHEGRSPIVLTERKEHVAFFSEHLRLYSRNLVVLTGGMSAEKRREATAQLAAESHADPRVVIATGGFAGEGFDDARLDTLFLTLPVSWKGVLVQYTGRLHRLHPNKRELRIFDYVDSEVPMLRRMFEKRLRAYRGIGYVEGELPPSFEALADPAYVFDEGREEEIDVEETDWARLLE